MPDKEALEAAVNKLAEWEALSEEAQRIAGVGTWRYAPDADVLTWSGEVYRMFGVPPDSFSRNLTNFLGCVHPDDRQEMLKANEWALATGERMEFEHRIVRPDSTVRVVRERAQVVALPALGGRVMIGTVQDVTEAKRAADTIAEQAKQLSKMQAELIFLARQCAMGTMAATLAHELNQPLTAISNYASALTRLPRDDPQAEVGLKQIQRNATRAGEIIRRVRQMMKPSVHQIKPIDLTTTLNEAVQLASLGACAGVGIQCRSSEGTQVYADSVQIQQVLVNIIRNSCEAVAASDIKLVAIETVHLGDFVKVCVTDTGAGVPTHNMATLFESGLSTKEDGMGIGLSISRTIIENHGGNIGAENTPAGARFWFTLPAAQ